MVRNDGISTSGDARFSVLVFSSQTYLFSLCLVDNAGTGIDCSNYTGTTRRGVSSNGLYATSYTLPFSLPLQSGDGGKGSAACFGKEWWL